MIVKEYENETNTFHTRFQQLFGGVSKVVKIYTAGLQNTGTLLYEYLPLWMLMEGISR